MNEKPRQVFYVDIIKKVGDLPTYLPFINNVCLLNKVLTMHENMIVFSCIRKMEKSKNYVGCLTDIHTLLHMPIELFRHASNKIPNLILILTLSRLLTLQRGLDMC
jgi:hypothetical protein